MDIEFSGGESGFQRITNLVHVPKALAIFGIQAGPILSSCGLPPDALDNADHILPYTKVGEMLDACVAATGCGHFGLLIGQNATPAVMGPLGAFLRNAPSLGDAVRGFISHQHDHADGGLCYLWPAGDQISFAYAVYNSGNTRWAPLLADTFLAGAARIIREISGVSPSEVVLAREAPADVSDYARHFNAPLRFNAEMSALVFSRSSFDSPIFNADAAARRQAQEILYHVDSLGLVSQIQHAIFPNILLGEVSLNRIAESLNLHPRTVNRRLKKCGTSFHAEVERARFELARQLLGNTRIPITQVSQAFGYASTGVFSRAFHRWAGRRPSDWREKR